jgi:hypothetical protein
MCVCVCVCVCVTHCVLTGDNGRWVFWILCRVQAEVALALPALTGEHGEDNTFPHFVRAVSVDTHTHTHT